MIDQNFWFKAFPAIVANALLILAVLVYRPKLTKYLLIFAVTTLVDILVASHIIPISNSGVQTSLEYLFVLIGDLRFIILLAFLLYAQKRMGDLHAFKADGSVFKPALVFTLAPTLMVAAIEYARPGLLFIGRHKFLAYELIFFTLTFLWIFVVLPQKNLPEVERRFLRRVSIPVFLFYGLWPAADLLILNSLEIGYVLRVVPNFLYYCAFLPWAWICSLRAE